MKNIIRTGILILVLLGVMCVNLGCPLAANLNSMDLNGSSGNMLHHNVTHEKTRLNDIVATKLTVGDVTGKIGDTVQIVANLKDSDGMGVVDATINFYLGKKILKGITNKDGVATVNYKIDPNDITSRFSVIYAGDAYHKSSKASAQLKVDKRKAFMYVPDISGKNGNKVDLKAVLKDKDSNLPIMGKWLIFYLNREKIGTAITDKTGTATLNYLISNNIGKYLIDVALIGDTEYENVTSSGNLIVNPIKTQIVVKSMNGYKGDMVKLRAVLSDENNHPVIGRTINFFINGNKIGSGVTDKNGMAGYVYKLLNTGNFTVNVLFEGDGIYSGSNGDGKLNVNPLEHLCLIGTTNNTHPKLGETFNISYKMLINGNDSAKNVTISFKIPEGFELISVMGSGRWIFNPEINTLTWIITSNIAEQNFYLILKAIEEGKYTITPKISSASKINITDVAILTFNVQKATNKTSNGTVHNDTKNSNKNANRNINLPVTGVPVLSLLLGILLILGGVVIRK